MVLLLVHTHWSLLTGPCSPRALCEEAARLGHSHLVLVDGNGLYGFQPFQQQARRMGLTPIFGVELVHAGRHVFALARSIAGYRSLCRLVTARQLDADFDLARAAAEHAGELLFVCADPELLLALAPRLPATQLFVGWPPAAHTDPAAVPLPQSVLLPQTVGRKSPEPLRWPPRAELALAARVHGLARVACWESWFCRPADFATHQAFVAVKHNRGLGGAQPLPAALPGQHLPARTQLAAAFAADGEAVALAAELCGRCALTFAPQQPPIFPVFPLPAGSTAGRHLAELARAGLAARMPAASRSAQLRLERELAVIEQTGFAPYFLVVHTIAEIARRRAIPCVGRGSAADSLVAYALGLTDADPIRYGLLFERFLNPARQDLPDIDLDFCWRRRDELLDAVYERFGRDRVAMIATYATLGPRGAWREAAKVNGLSPREVDRRCRGLPHHREGERTLGEMLAETPGRSGDAALEQAIATLGEALLQAPTHLGIHAGGVVITPGPITDHVPLERASKGLVVTQYDMRFCEALGLVKIDLLGNRALTILSEARTELRALGCECGEAPELPEDDPATAQLLAQGRTLGCFQIESPAMRTLLRQLRARTLDRVIQAIALVRPGPSASGMKDAFVRRARGEEPITAAHPLLAEVFADTYGILLYQEDVIRAAMAIAGCDAAAGDQLRRTLGKLVHDRAGGQEALDRFVVAGLQHGHDQAVIREIWDAMARFAGFSFCKAHAVTYGRIAYRCAWWKAHAPAAFLCSVLRNDAGYYEKGVYVEEAKRLGVRMLPPCVNRGGRAFALERLPGGSLALRVGLGEISGLGAEDIDRVLAARAAIGPFGSLADLATRTHLGQDALERLVLAGGCDGFGPSRPSLLVELQLRRMPGPRRDAARSLFASWPEPEPLCVPQLPEYSPARRTALELDLLGYALAAHPVVALWHGRRPRHALPIDAVTARAGGHVTLFGWIVAMRRLRTKADQPMLFFSLEDQSGIVECVVMPDRYRLLAAHLLGRGPFVVTGVVDTKQDGLCVRVATILADTTGPEEEAERE